jgi:hypothetical protein
LLGNCGAVNPGSTDSGPTHFDVMDLNITSQDPSLKGRTRELATIDTSPNDKNTSNRKCVAYTASQRRVAHEAAGKARFQDCRTFWS